jgi:phosphoribosylglycinamide formyltransferase-1
MEALLRAHQAAPFAADPVLVVSNVPDAAGLAVAAGMGAATEVVDHRNRGGRVGFEAALQAVLDAHAVDWVFLAGFMRVLTPDFTDRWRDRLVNIHPSLLPDFPGLDTHQRAIDAGAARHGCTVHMVRAGVDTGPIVAQASLPMRDGEDAPTLARRVLALEHRLYPAAVRALTDGRVRIENERAVPVDTRTARELWIRSDD